MHETIELKPDKTTRGTVRVSGELAATGQVITFYIPKYLLHVAGLPQDEIVGTLIAEPGSIRLEIEEFGKASEA